MNTKRRRAVAFFIGVLVFLFVIECALRVVGLIYTHSSDSDKNKIRHGVQHTILCEGDSFTFGLGAERTMSYPAQLERLLNTSQLKRSFTVINRGVPARNTAQLLNFLERDIKAVEPTILLVLAGGANLWNYWGYKAYSEQNKFLAFINDQLYRIRLYKLVKLISRNLSTKIHRGKGENYPILQKAIPDSGSFFSDQDRSEILLSPDTTSENCFDKGATYAEMGDYVAAEKFFRKGIRLDPSYSVNYEGLGWMYCGQKEFKKALHWFKKAIEIDPSNSNCYGGIAQSFSEMHMYNEAIEFFKKESVQNPAAYDYITLFETSLKKDTRNEVIPWVQADVERIISMARQYNIAVILQSYPEHVNNPGYDMINDVVKKVANRLGVLFVDHSSFFKKLEENKAPPDEYFVPDGHPNSRGYGLMAKSIFDTLQRNNTLGRKK